MRQRNSELLVQWEPRWKAFLNNLGPALTFSSSRLPFEHSGPRGKSMLASVAFHAVMITAVCLLWDLPILYMAVPKPLPPEMAQVIYYQAEQLPQVNDRGGAEEGLEGRSGGREFYHPTQTIRVARGPRLVERVVDAPKLKLPKTSEPVANLLALGGPVAPAAPADSVTRSLSALALEQEPSIAPPPEAPRLDFKPLAKAPEMTDVKAPLLPAPSRKVAQLVRPPVEVALAPQAVVEVASDPKLRLPVGATVANAPDMKAVAREMAALPSGMTVVKPPAPTLAAGNSAGKPGGAAAGRQSTSGSASGVPGGVGTPSAGAPSPEPGLGGNGGPTGIIVSVNPGDKLGMPAESELGALSMSPHGGKQVGFGGSGGGSGIGSGTGPGSGKVGVGPGSGKAGSGLGANPNAKGGTSLGPGPGGAGNGGNSSAGGITVRGGAINLPSFAAGPGLNPNVPGPPGPRNTPAVVIVAGPRAGGALNRYGALKGAKVYTIYLDTRLGTAVLQYADASAAAAFAEELTAPELKHSEFPAEMSKTIRFVVSGIIDARGILKNLKVLESSNTQLTTRMLSALANWRFRPALRGEDPIDAQAILGLGVDTR